MGDNVAEKLLQVLEQTRQTGTTTTLLRSAVESDGVILVSSRDQGRRLRSELKSRGVQGDHVYSMYELDKLRGRDFIGPLLIDTDVVGHLCRSLQAGRTDRSAWLELQLERLRTEREEWDRLAERFREETGIPLENWLSSETDEEGDEPLYIERSDP